MAKFYDAVLRLTPDPFIDGLKKAEDHLQKFEKEYKRSGREFKNASKTFEGAGKSLMKLTAPLAGFLGYSVKVGMEFEEVMSSVEAISGANITQMQQLEKLAKTIGRDTKFSAVEAAEGLKYTSMAGWETQDMLNGFPAIVNLAIASGEELATTSDIVTDALTAFKLSTKDATMFTDVLAVTTNKSNTSVGMLGETFKYVAPIAGAFGYSIQDVALSAGLMANAGVKGAMAGRSLKTAMNRLVKPTKDVVNGLDMLNLGMDDLTGSSWGKQLELMRNGFAQLDQVQQGQAAAMIFGSEAMAGMLAIMGASDEDFNNLKQSIEEATGITEKMAKIMQDNLGGSFESMKSAIEAAALVLAETLIPPVRKAVDKVTELAVAFTKLSPEVQQTVTNVSVFLVAMGPVLLFIGKILGLMAKAKFVFGDTAKAVKNAGGILALITGPVGKVVLAITAIIIVGALLIKHWDDIKAKAEEIFPGIGATFSHMGDNIKIIFGGIKDFLLLGLDTIKNMWEATWIAFGPIIEGVLGHAKILIEIFIGVLDGLLEFIAGVFTGDWEKAWNGIISIFDSIFSGIGNIIKNTMNIGIKYINKLINGINSVKPPEWVPLIGGKSTNIPNIPQLATGTNNWQGGLAEINERGRKEIVDLPDGSRVIPHHKSIDEAYKDGAKGKTTQNNVTYQTINIPKLADQVTFKNENDMDTFMKMLAKELKFAKQNAIAQGV